MVRFKAFIIFAQASYLRSSHFAIASLFFFRICSRGSNFDLSISVSFLEALYHVFTCWCTQVLWSIYWYSKFLGPILRATHPPFIARTASKSYEPNLHKSISCNCYKSQIICPIVICLNSARFLSCGKDLRRGWDTDRKRNLFQARRVIGDMSSSAGNVCAHQVLKHSVAIACFRF